MMFDCDKCGCCCRNLDKSPLYSDLNRGDGTCKYLTGNLCSIYENRPFLCRVDDSYDRFFRDIMPKEKYLQLNEQMCKQLKTGGK